MKNKQLIFKELTEKIFSDWPKWKKDLIEIGVNKPLTVALCKHGKNWIPGVAKCAEEDTFSDEIGAEVALKNLKKRVEYLRKFAEAKTWVPKQNDSYCTFTVFVNSDGDELLDIIDDVSWQGDAVDYMRLGMGIVFKNARDARKYARTLEITGRHIKNERKLIP